MGFITWILPNEFIFYLFCVLFSDVVPVRTMLLNIFATMYPFQCLKNSAEILVKLFLTPVLLQTTGNNI